MISAMVLSAQVTPTGAKLSTADQAGLLYASNFGQWRMPVGNLGQYSWDNGSYCMPTVGSVYPGITINAFTVGTPVEIVDMDTPSHNEIVTPTAVTISWVGSDPVSCSISITPVYGHNHFYFTSATGGLQEAINWAGTTPYQVIVTPDWSLLGGITSTITSATGNANVTILDDRTACSVAYLWSGGAYTAQNSSCGGGNISGSGTHGYVPVFTGTNSIGNSVIDQGVTNVGSVTIDDDLSVAGNVAAASAVTSPSISSMGNPVYNVVAYGAVNDNATDSTAALQTTFAACGVTGGTVLIPGTASWGLNSTPGSGNAFLTSSSLVLPINCDLEVEGTVRATAAMNAVISTGYAANPSRGHFIYGAGLIDPNNMAAVGIYLRRYDHFTIWGVNIGSATAAGIHLGDPSISPNASYEAVVEHVNIVSPASLAVNVGSIGIYQDQGSNGLVTNNVVVGYDIGIKSNHGDVFAHNHVWAKESICYDDESGGAATWIANVVDTPTTYGYYVSRGRFFVNGGDFLSSTSTGPYTGIYFAYPTAIASISNLYIQGNSSALITPTGGLSTTAGLMVFGNQCYDPGVTTCAVIAPPAATSWNLPIGSEFIWESDTSGIIETLDEDGTEHNTGPITAPTFKGGNFSSAPIASPSVATFSTSPTGGSLAASTAYCYRVAADNGIGHTLANAETCLTTGSSTSTNTIGVGWQLVPGAQSYRIYGRTPGSELLIAGGVQGATYVDDGSITPSGALPSSNTTQGTFLINGNPVVPLNATGYTGSGTLMMTGQTCTTGSIGGVALVAGGTATGTCAVTASPTATGHTGQAAASDGSVQGNYDVHVSVVGQTAMVTLTAIVAGTPTAKTYNVTVF
jgi:hypothetical protein